MNVISRAWENLKGVKRQNHFLADSKKMFRISKVYVLTNTIIEIIFLFILMFFSMTGQLIILIYWTMLLIFVMVSNYVIMEYQVKIFLSRWMPTPSRPPFRDRGHSTISKHTKNTPQKRTRGGSAGDDALKRF